MADIILHHYSLSPFSEKVRKAFAVKRIAWCGVEQPMWSPKPKLTALTGGYRRIPVMQIGADVYCDTALILRELDVRHPEPTLVPAAHAGTAELVAWWADRQLFPVAATLVLATIGHTLPPEFKADRERMVPGLKIDALAGQAPHARAQFRAFCGPLDRQLATTPFLLGAAFSIADAACFHCLWFARLDPGAAQIVAGFPALAAWFERVDALGHGDLRAFDPDAALAVAAQSEPATRPTVDPGAADGVRFGDRVTVTPDDYAFDPVVGDVVVLTASEVAVSRHDPQVGEVVVHFPRAGYRVAQA